MMKINNTKISLQQFLPLSEAEEQLSSTQSETPLALIPLAPEFQVSFKVCTQL
jgi:hypothetical protein